MKFTFIFSLLFCLMFSAFFLCCDDDDDPADDDSITDDDEVDDDAIDDDAFDDDATDDDVIDDDVVDDDTVDDDVVDDDIAPPPSPAGLVLIYYTGEISGNGFTYDFTSYVAGDPFVQWREVRLPEINFTALTAYAMAAHGAELLFMPNPGPVAQIGGDTYAAIDAAAMSTYSFGYYYTAAFVLLRYSSAEQSWDTTRLETVLGPPQVNSVPFYHSLHPLGENQIGLVGQQFFYEAFPHGGQVFFDRYDTDGSSPARDWSFSAMPNDLFSSFAGEHGLVLIDQEQAAVYDEGEWSGWLPAYPAGGDIRRMWVFGPDEEWYAGAFGRFKPLLHRVGDNYERLPLPGVCLRDYVLPKHIAIKTPLIVIPGVGFAFLDADGSWICSPVPDFPDNAEILAAHDANLFYFQGWEDGEEDARVFRYQDGTLQEMDAPGGLEGWRLSKAFIPYQ